jgi:cytochrome c biogenesis protein
LVLLLVNTCCCFIDWLVQLRSRWRKSGEYLIHLGFVLMLLGFIWGSLAGWRHVALPCGLGELTPLPHWPGHYLAVDEFEPSFGKRGQFLDMISQVRLLRGEQELVAAEVRINQPLLFEKLVVTPASFSQKVVGFHFIRDGQIVTLRSGSVMTLEDGRQFEVLRFFADARTTRSGQVVAGRPTLGNPAMEIRQRLNQQTLWQGWYFIGSEPPAALMPLQLRPAQPLYQSFSHLTINYDPGVRIAATGAALMAAGCLIALFSFYRKRRHQDRPEV